MGVDIRCLRQQARRQVREIDRGGTMHLFHPGYASRTCSTWMASARVPSSTTYASRRGPKTPRAALDIRQLAACRRPRGRNPFQYGKPRRSAIRGNYLTHQLDFILREHHRRSQCFRARQSSCGSVPGEMTRGFTRPACHASPAFERRSLVELELEPSRVSRSPSQGRYWRSG